jgi:UDP-3-O-[3-hydroxymyristoyl] glucosamine N-acyltransferase
MPEYSIKALAELVDGDVRGDASRTVRGVAPLESAGPDMLSLVASRKYLPYVSRTQAAAVLVTADIASALPPEVTRICVPDVHAALGEILPLLHPAPRSERGIHPTAVVDVDAEVGEQVSIGAYAVIARGARLGDRVRVGPHSVVGEASRVGDDSVLHPHVTLYPGVVVGERCILHSGVRLGSDGFGYTWTGGQHRKVPQVGGCRLDDDVEIGANTTIDRGSIGDTVVGQGTKIDNLVHIGHNVQIGKHAILVAQVGIAGSSRIGDGAVLGGQAGIGGHITVGPGAKVGGQAGVTGDVPAKETVSGYPARAHREALRAQASLFRLPSLLQRIQQIERRLDDNLQVARERKPDPSGAAE